MSRSRLYLDVAEARSLTAYALYSLRPVPEETHRCLQSVDEALEAAAGGVPPGPSAVIDKVAVFAAAWAGAAVAHDALHLGAGWTIAVSVIVMLAGSGLASALSRWTGPRLVRRRLAAIPLERQPVGRDGRVALVQARAIVIAAVRREAGPGGVATLSFLRWARLRHRAVRNLSTADRHLCIAIELHFTPSEPANG